MRESVLKRDSYLCRSCGAPAQEVHHIEWLTPENIGNDIVTLNPDNLIALCRDCHCGVHKNARVAAQRKTQPQVFDENGFLIG